MTRKGGTNDNNPMQTRREYMGSAGGLVALQTGFLDMIFGEDPPTGATIAFDLEAELDNYDTDDYDLFITKKGTVYVEEDAGEWDPIETTGPTPSFANGNSVDNQGRWNGPVVLPGTSNFSGGIAGRLVWDTNRQIPAFDDGNDVNHPVVGDDVGTEYTTVENTTTETTVWSGSLDEHSMQPGRVYEIYLLGAYTTNDGTDQFTLRLYAGGTEITTVQSVANQVTDAPISVTARLVVQSDGESGTIIPHTEAVFDNAHGDDPTLTPVSIDTTQLTELEATVQWSVAEAGDTVDALGYIKEVA